MFFLSTIKQRLLYLGWSKEGKEVTDQAGDTTIYSNLLGRIISPQVFLVIVEIDLIEISLVSRLSNYRHDRRNLQFYFRKNRWIIEWKKMIN